MKPMVRRSFIRRFTGAAAFFGAGGVSASAQSTSAGDPFRPARHPQDDWFDQVPGKHRFFFDTTTAAKVGEAVMFAGNYLNANKSAYGLDDRDLAVVICLRHRATAFAYNDQVWARYGRQLSDILENFTDPKTKQPPTINVYTGMPALLKRGVQLAVCDMATHALSRKIAETTDGDPAAIYKEFVANTLGNSHFVPAGIVAVNRAQERGYSIVHVG